MGDRALIQFTDGKEFSPVIYLHWHGSEVRELLNTLQGLMGTRADDLAYTTARFIGVCHSRISGALSLGVWNNDKQETDSHGDNGIFIVHLPSFKVDND